MDNPVKNIPDLKHENKTYYYKGEQIKESPIVKSDFCKECAKTEQVKDLCRFCGREAVEKDGCMTFPCDCAQRDFDNTIELEHLEYGKGW
jgi:hypothetical protein